jgi:hypothetical protein
MRIHDYIQFVAYTFARGSIVTLFIGVYRCEADENSKLLPVVAEHVMVVHIIKMPAAGKGNGIKGAFRKHTIDSVKILRGKTNPVRQNLSQPRQIFGAANPRVSVVDTDGNILFETEFNYPKVLTVPLPANGLPPDNIPPVISIDSPDVSLVIPYFPEGVSVQVFDAGETAPDHSMPINNPPTDTFATDLTNSAKFPSPAPSLPGKFNLLIMASGYPSGSLTNFQNTATNVRNIFLGTAPYSTYASQLNINIYNNTADLGCYSGCYNIDRLMCCNVSSVMSAAAASGYLYDEIIVIHNTSTYSGGGYRDTGDYKTNSYSTFCAIYDGQWSEGNSGDSIFN